jgi:hypothetical protein
MKTQLHSIVVGLLFAISMLLPNIIQSQTARVELDSVWGCPGQTVEMPVRVYGVKQLGLDAFTFWFEMDSVQLESALISWNPGINQGSPLITDWNSDILERGSFSATNYFFGNGKAIIAMVWLDATLGRPKLEIEDGEILFKINLRIKETGSVVTPTTATMSYQAARHGNYTVDRTNSNGHILAASVPNVKIDDTYFVPQMSNMGIQFADLHICENHTFAINVSGGERYEWNTYLGVTGGSNRFPANSAHFVLDRVDVHNPVFTPVPVNWGSLLGMYNYYNLLVRGYDIDGCVGIDSIRIRVTHFQTFPIRQPEQPQIIVDKGETIDLELRFQNEDPLTGAHTFTTYNYRWFPEEEVEKPRDSVTKSLPINEPTWFWGEVTDPRNNCTQTLNIRVNIRGEMFDARLRTRQNDDFLPLSGTTFCGAPGETEHEVSLAALVEGGSDSKEYTWEFRPFYSGQEPKFSNVDGNGAKLTFFGTTEVSVRIYDPISMMEISLIDTLNVEEITHMSIRIEMDEASQRQYEIGYCIDMPITFLATVENAGNDYQIFWETNGFKRQGREGHRVEFESAGHQDVFRAVLHSPTKKCLAQNDVRSNEIDPKSGHYEVVGVWMSSVIRSSNCNNDSVKLSFSTHNMGINPFFQIYRNDVLLDTFTHFGKNDLAIEKMAESVNYWDRFSVKLTNKSAKCLALNNRMSNYESAMVNTNENLNILGIVSDVGGNAVCNSSEGIYTYRIEGMEQFGRNSTVIWMLNDKEWGRYEFDPTLAEQFATELPEKRNGNFVINTANDLEWEIFAQRYPFHINAENFPKVGETFTVADSLSVIVITRALCEISENEKIVMKNFDGIRPNFMPLEPAIFTVTPDNGLMVCKGGELTFSANIQNVSFGTTSWYFNNRKFAEGPTFTAKNLFNNDSVYAIFESTYPCITNKMPLKSVVQKIKTHDLPTLIVQKDTLICDGETVQLSVETSATQFAWNPNSTLSATDIQQPIAAPNSGSINHYIITVTDDNGCSATETLIVRTAPRYEATVSISLANPADTTMCIQKLVRINSVINSVDTRQASYRWLRNGFFTGHTTTSMESSAVRNEDAWQFQATFPLLNTCLSRTIVSNVIEFRVDPPVETLIVDEETTLCEGDSVLLTALGGAHHRWTTADGTVVGNTQSIYVKPTETTTFFVRTYSPQSLCYSEDNIEILVERAVPIAHKIQIDPIHINHCANAENIYKFNALPTNSGQNPTFEWYVNGVYVASSFVPNYTATLNPGDKIHSVMHADVESCRSKEATSNIIEILPVPMIPIIIGNTELCDGQTATLEVQDPENGVTYFWYSSKDLFVNSIGTGTKLSNLQAGQYLVLAIGENDCESLEGVSVNVDKFEHDFSEFASTTHPTCTDNGFDTYKCIRCEKTEQRNPVNKYIHPTARVELITPPADIQTRETIRFRNRSTDWDRAFWTFGNEPEFEDDRDVVEHTFTEIKIHQVTLRLVSDEGCETTFRMDLDVRPNFSGVFVPSAFMPSSNNPDDNVL